MRALVVQAHPTSESFNRAVFTRTVDAMSRAGHPPECARLYDGDDPDVGDVDWLTLVYPTWWGGLPAILADWVQRRLGPWLDRAPQAGPSPLRRVQHLVAVTTHGSTKVVNVLQGEPGLRLLRHDVLPLCGLDADFSWLALHDIDRSTAEQRRRFLERIERRMLTIAAGLTVPSSGR